MGKKGASVTVATIFFILLLTLSFVLAQDSVSYTTTTDAPEYDVHVTSIEHGAGFLSVKFHHDYATALPASFTGADGALTSNNPEPNEETTLIIPLANDAIPTVELHVGDEVITFGEQAAEEPAEQATAPEPETPPEQTPPATTNQESTPADVEVEPAVEHALAANDTVSVIIILKDIQETTAEQPLEEKQEAVEDAQQAFYDEQPQEFSTASADVVVQQEYDTINALSAEVTQDGLEQLRNNPAVEEVIIDRMFSVAVNDSIPLVNADDVHALTINGTKLNGTGQTICILDTGIEYNHSAFTNRLHQGYDFVNNDSNASDDSGNSHGTHVAGTAAGQLTIGNGMAPSATILPVKVCTSGGSCSGSNILAGIDYCNNNSATYNISVMSVSISDSGQYTAATCPTFFESALQTANSLGIIPVFASGNDGYTSGISYPACSPYSLSVGSTTKANAMSSFTNRGGDRLDILAPGSGIISSIQGNTLGTLSGTSMATPHVSGLVALIQQNEHLNNRSSLNLSTIRTLLNNTGVSVSGYKRIDSYAAIASLNGYTSFNGTSMNVTTSYNLTSDYNGTIYIRSDNLILNCQGYAINSGSQPAIVAENRNNITVANCSMTGTTDIFFNGTSSSTVQSVEGNGSIQLYNSDDNHFVNATVSSNDTWISTDSGSTGNTFEELTITNDYGSIEFLSNLTASAPTTANQTNLNISTGRVFLNSTQLGWMNKTAEVTLTGLQGAVYNGITPAASYSQIPLIDENDDGVFTLCPETICNQTTYSANSLVFVTQHFTTINSSTSFPLTINDSSTLTSNITVNTTAVVLGNNSISFDCNGFTITWDATGTGADAIIAQSRTNVTIQNCIAKDGNASGSGGIGITFNTVKNSSIINNTIRTNGTSDNYAILINSSSENITVLNNTLRAFGTSSGNVGIITILTSIKTFIIGNNIRTFGGGLGNMGIQLQSNNATLIENNTIITDGTSNGNYGVDAVDTINATVYNNTITTNGTSSNVGIQFRSSLSAANRAERNTVVTNGTGASNFGIVLDSSGQNNTAHNNNVTTTGGGFAIGILSGNTGNVTNNTITTGGSSDNYGIQIHSSAAQNLVENNTVITNGTTANYGIRLASVQNNTLRNNIVTTDGTGGNFGIQAESSANNTITNTTITTYHSSYGINNSGSNNTYNITRITAQDWILSDSTSRTNLTNTTFATANGNITFSGNVQYNGTLDVTQTKLNISSNRTFVNSTNLTPFNTSAQITLNGITFSDPQPLVDFNDNGAFASCNATICTEISFANNIYIFNVTRFTTYSSSNNGSNVTFNLTTSTTLTQNVTVTGAAFTFTTDNITMDCAGFTVTGNSTSFAFNATSRRNITIKNCIVTNFSVGIDADFTNTISISNNTITIPNTAGFPINVLRTNHSTIYNNSFYGESAGISLGGNNNTIQLNHITSIQSHGISIGSLSNSSLSNNFVRGNSSGLQTQTFGSNLTIVNSTFYGNSGRGLNFGDLRSSIVENNSVFSDFESAMRHQSGTNNNFSNNNFTANTFNGIGIDDTGNRFHNTIITSNGSWMFTTIAGNNVSNLTFRNLNGSIRISNTTLPNTGGFITQSQLNITSSGAFLNSSNLTFFNTSATITLLNRTNPSLGIRVDFEDDGTFALCSSTICTGTTFSSGTLTFNVTRFTTYSGNDTFPATLLDNGTLTSNISINGSGITLGADNITLDCAGFTMTGNQTGTGITATNRTNVTIKNCIIRNFLRNIEFSITNNSFIINTTVINSTQENILLSGGNSDVFNTLNITSNATSHNSITFSGGTNQTFANSTASSTGALVTTVATGSSTSNFTNISSTAVSTSFSISGENNTATNLTTTGGNGFVLTGTGNNITNIIVTGGTGGFISQGAINNRITNATVRTTSGNGVLDFVSGRNNTYTNINSTNPSTTSSDAALDIRTTNITVTNATISCHLCTAISITGNDILLRNVTARTNLTWLATSTPVSTNFTNVTFATGNGSISIANTTLASAATVNQVNLNITPNKAFLNSSNLSFFNTTSQITLNGLTTTTAQALVDLEDDNTFAPCPAPRCTLISYTGGIFIFNVTNWTSYSSTDGGINLTFTKTDSQDPVNAGNQFNYTITVNITNGTAFNTSVRETLPSGIVFISSQPSPTIAQSSSVNYTLNNLTNGTIFIINITVLANSSAIFQNTTVNNSVAINYSNSTGSSFQTTVNESTNVTIPSPVNISSNTTLNTNVTGSFNINTSNLIFDCNGNTITGTATGTAISAGSNITNVTIRNCRIFNFTTGILFTNTSQSTILNSTINVTTTSVSLASTSLANNLTNNTLADTTTWITTSSTANTTLTNTNFSNSQGNIRIIPAVNMTNGTTISTNNLNIGTRRANLKSDQLPFFNTTSQITFLNSTVTAPVMIVDFEDDGSFVQCPSNICTEASNTGSTYIMNVTRWTTYGIVAGGANVTITKTDSSDPILNGSTLTYQITVSVTNGMAVNLTVFETYPANTTFNSSQPTPTSGNNFFNLGNLTENTTFIINITLNVSANFTGTLTNNITVNFSNSTTGNFSTNVSESTTVSSSLSSGSSGGGGSGGGGGGSGGVCYPICLQPGNENLPQCVNCPPKIEPVVPTTTPTFPSAFTPTEEPEAAAPQPAQQEPLPEPQAATPIVEATREHWANYGSTIKNVLLTILIILAVLVVGYGSYNAYKNRPKGMKHDIGGLLSEIKETEDKLKHMKGKFK